MAVCRAMSMLSFLPRPWEGLLGVNYERKNLKLDKPLKVGAEKWIKVRVPRKGENLCLLSTRKLHKPVVSRIEHSFCSPQAARA